MRFAWWLVALALILGGVSVWAGQRLHVNAQLEALLPQDTPSAQANRELSERLRSSTPLYLLVQSDDIEQARQMAARMAAEVRKWPEAKWVMRQRDPDYFLNNRLLYLSADDLRDLNEQIDERRRYEECERVPGCINIEDEVPPLPTDEDLAALLEKDRDVRALVSLFGKEAAVFSKARPDAPGSGAAAGASPGERGEEQHLGELCDVEKGVCTVQVSLEGDASDLRFAQQILERSEALFERLEADALDTSLRFAVSGQYRNVPMTQRNVARDLARTSILSLALILLVVLLQFRGWRSVVILAVPMASGIAWTALGLSFLHPSLNLISAFTLAVLAGIGIDFGVHLLTHYGSHRRDGEPPQQALETTLTGILPSLGVAAGTTAVGFGALTVASFRGFSEMGPIAAAGVLTSLIASLLLFPPLVAVLDTKTECPFALREYRWLAPFPWVRKHAAAIALLLAGIAVVGGVKGSGLWGEGVEFEYDFNKLRPQNVSHGIPWGETLHGTTRSAVYLLADDQQSLDEVAAALRREPPTDILRADDPFLIIPGAFVPPQQAERLKAISELRGTVERAKEQASSTTRQRIEDFLPLVSVTEPIVDTKMPLWVSDWLRERDGRFGTLGILYNNLRGSDARDMELLVRHMNDWRRRFPKVRFASPVAQLGEVTPRLREEGPWIIGLALLGVCTGTLLIGRSLRRAALVLLPTLLMVGFTIGFMAMGEFRVNLYNMLVFPLAFGIGIDGAVYIAWALSAAESNRNLSSAGRAVLGSTVTTIAGFGSLMISSNPGLVSIGELAVLMLAFSLVANLIWLPALTWSLAGRAKTAS